MTETSQTSPDGVRPVIEAAHIAKSYGHVQALTDASLAVYPGEILALIGDNGAGKSTLTKVIGGVIRPDSGTLRFDGREVQLSSVRDAQGQGVEVVYQDLAQAPDLTIAENFFLGRERTRAGVLGRLGFVDKRSMRQQAAESLAQLGSRIQSLNVPVQSLSGGQRQAVAVGRAVMWASKAVLMDEPTAALGARQTAMVYEAIEKATQTGLAVVLVSHDIPKMIEFAHRLVIMRHGAVVTDMPARDAELNDVLALMISGERASR